MKPSLISLQTFKPSLPAQPAKLFQIPKLSSISTKDLPNNGFGKGTYFFSKTKFGHWRVYKKVQNTKITTELTQIKGDVLSLKHDLIKIAKLNPKTVTANPTTGIINIKGDVVDEIKQLFNGIN
ncbi:54S ribosomal protein Img2p, mitochondrial [[Candida] jaroonii]|uniref:54S ribosomal protein Img2p, mitochondrial n=1 Tax=[Candida] jaroonii TaxID=467808 RepID=A0ACA9YDR6_9ASCO|nr:54S ribosomal protein Img2p, mitochondrial [[Candida] jaroonii]